MTLVAAAGVLTGCGYRGALMQSYIPEVPDSCHYAGVSPEYQQLAALLEKDTGLPPVPGNTICFIPSGARKLELMLEDLRASEESIYLDHYRFCTDSAGTIVKDILLEKAGKGVDVRVIVDTPANDARHLKKLSAINDAGGHFYKFHKPVMVIDHIIPPAGTHRDHRKILIIDGKTAYLGGRNIQDKYYNSWRDADVRITGPVIETVSKVYMENLLRVEDNPKELKIQQDLQEKAAADSLPSEKQFYGKTVQVVQDSPTDKILPIRNCFEWSIGHAKKYFWVYTPYTPPPKSTVKALCDAARRGVDVRWIMQGESDVFFEKYMAESLYKKLLEAGVKIYEWQNRILHAKQFLSDDNIMVIGSANMDNLSFFLNYEVEAVIYDSELTQDAARLYLEDTRERCREVSLDEVRQWSIFRRFRNWLIYIIGGHVG